MTMPRLIPRTYRASPKLSQFSLAFRPQGSPQCVATSSRPAHLSGVTQVSRFSTSTADSAADITEKYAGRANVEMLARISRDFRTDTITMPTDAQIEHARTSTRGDDVEGEDTTTTALEARIAKLSGKEAALFCASATMCNALAVRTHLPTPPCSLIADSRSHTFRHEAGGAALFSQATTHALTPANGLYLTREDVEPALNLGTDVHMAPTRLVCLENTLNGVVVPGEVVKGIRELAGEVPDMARKMNDTHAPFLIHLDGSRAWHAAAVEIESRRLPLTEDKIDQSLGQVLGEMLDPVDSATLCLSKGLGAPIGSALVGSKAFISRAKWFRKAFGGGWRQSGHLAAQASWALTHHFPRLSTTHALARQLASELESLGCEILLPVESNMVWVNTSPIGVRWEEVVDAARERGVTVGSNRLVVHHQICAQGLEELVATVKEVKGGVGRQRGERGESVGKMGVGYR